MFEWWNFAGQGLAGVESEWIEAELGSERGGEGGAGGWEDFEVRRPQLGEVGEPAFGRGFPGTVGEGLDLDHPVAQQIEANAQVVNLTEQRLAGGEGFGIGFGQGAQPATQANASHSRGVFRDKQ